MYGGFGLNVTISPKSYSWVTKYWFTVNLVLTAMLAVTPTGQVKWLPKGQNVRVPGPLGWKFRLLKIL
jgi:hypothetical protein